MLHAGTALRRPALRASRPSPLPDVRRRVLPEPRLLQPAARLRRRVRRARAVALLRHAGHQLHAQPAGQRLGGARLAARTPRVAHLSALPVPGQPVQRAHPAAGARLPPAVRRPLHALAAEAADSPLRRRPAVADLPAAVQPRTARTRLHVSRHRLQEADRTRRLQILVPRYRPCHIAYILRNVCEE